MSGNNTETTSSSKINDLLLPFLMNNNENPSLIISGNYTQNPSSSKIDSITPKQSVATIFSGTNNTETPSSSKIVVTPKRSVESIFKDVIRWPEAKIQNSKRKKEHIPSVITSDRWIEYQEAKEKEKQEKDRIKTEKKALRLKNQQMKLNKKVKLEIIDKSALEEEDWMENQINKDEIEEKGSEKPVELSATSNLKPGDFVLVKFTNNEKKKPTVYRYVATILKVLSSEEIEIKCLKSANVKKTCFSYIENDISTITIDDVIGKLPEPQLIQKGRVLQTKFPGLFNVFEKH